MYPEADRQFRETFIAEVEEESSGWSIRFSDGRIIGVPADSPIVPTVGMLTRLYGKGLGYPVRGLFLGGIQVFYRTMAEQKEHEDGLPLLSEILNRKGA